MEHSHTVIKNFFLKICGGGEIRLVHNGIFQSGLVMHNKLLVARHCSLVRENVGAREARCLIFFKQALLVRLVLDL